MKWLAPTFALLTSMCVAEHASVDRGQLDQAAQELLALQNGDGEPVHLHTRGVRKSTAWFGEQVGRCDRVELDRDIDPTRSLYVFHCERGDLQAVIGLDDAGQVSVLRMGARSIAPPARVSEVAAEWLESRTGQRRARGCSIDRVAIGSPSAALFVMTCPDGEKTLRVELDREGQAKRIRVTDGAGDHWRRLG